jgi:ATP-binding cassette subfamily F protein uup
MSLVSLHSISLAFGGPLLLDGVSLDIHQGQRICLLGRNGAGKSTFMKIIAGELSPDGGEIIVAPGVRIGYLPQNEPHLPDGTVFDLVAPGAGETGRKLALLHRLTAGHGDADRIAHLHLALDRDDGWRIQSVIERVLDQVRLKPDLEAASLSGGHLRRAHLARAMASEPDLLLLDEPTNHLDIESIAWLETFLLDARCTTLFITHDRRLLRRLATRIVELDRGRLVDWSCDYETFCSRKQALLDAEESSWDRFDKKLAEEEAWIRRGIKARRTRNEGRVRALVEMRAERRRRRERTGIVSMTIGAAKRSGERVIEAKRVGFTYGATPIVYAMSTTIMRGDRIGIIGPNGCGKTTLLNLLLGRIAPQEGVIRFGANLVPAYFDQLRHGISPEKTLWENVVPGGHDTITVNGVSRHIISYLRDFLFSADRAHCPAKQLSGGECNRLMLARLFTQPANLLVFDEPTNDLDTETLELLEELLLEYTGTVLCVSHDREFLNNIVTSTLVFEGNGAVREYIGGYDDWQRMKAAAGPVVNAKPVTLEKPRQTATLPRAQKKLSFKETRELESLPSLIDALEQEHGALNGQMADPAFFSKPGFVTSAKERIATIDRDLAAAYQRWEELIERPA